MHHRSLVSGKQWRALSAAEADALDQARQDTWRPRGRNKGLADLRELLEAAMQKPTPDGKRTRLAAMIDALAERLAVADQAAVELVVKRVWPAVLEMNVNGSLALQPENQLEQLESALDRLEAARRADGRAPAALALDPTGEPQ